MENNIGMSILAALIAIAIAFPLALLAQKLLIKHVVSRKADKLPSTPEEILNKLTSVCNEPTLGQGPVP